MAYKQLDFRKRCQIYGLWKAGHSQFTFVRTALGSWQYKPNYAQTNTEDRQKEKAKLVKFTE